MTLETAHPEVRTALALIDAPPAAERRRHFLPGRGAAVVAGQALF